MTGESETPTPSRLRRILRWLKIGSAVALTLFLALWFLSPAGAAKSPIRLERDDDGTLQVITAPQKPLLHFGAQATSLKANNMLATGSTSENSSPPWFRCESILILNRSDHLLMKRVGEALVEDLKKDMHLNRIDYLPYGHNPERGRLTPDFIVTLTLDSIEETGLVNRSLKAHVFIGIGANYTNSQRSGTDNQTPPIVRFNGTARLEHESMLSGVESAGARYTVQGKGIAEQVSNGIDQQLKQLREKNDPLPQLPDGFYPEYREAPAFKFLTQTGAVELTSFHELMASNETFWQLGESAEPRATVELVRAELAGAGWKASEHNDDPEKGYLRMLNGDQLLEVFPQRFDGVPASQAPKSPLFVRFRERMSVDELNGVIQTLLDTDSPDVSLLLDLQRYCSRPQRARVLELVESSPPRSISAWMSLARMYAGKNQKDATFRALQRAHALSLTQGHMTGRSPTNEIERLAKKHELDHKQIKQFEPALFDELGFVRLGGDVLEGTSEIRGSTPAAFFVPHSEPDKWKVFAVYAESLRGNRARLTTVESSHGGGRTTYRSEITLDRPHERHHEFNDYSARSRVEYMKNGVIEVSVELTPRQAP